MHVKSSTNATSPCCWVHENLGTLDDEASLDSLWKNDAWEKMRRDMWESNGSLPSQCPPYCAGVLETVDHEYDANVHYCMENDVPWNYHIKSLDITAANACNLLCKMCWIFDDFDYEIPKIGASRLIDECIASSKNLHDFKVGISGGEIFYSKHIRKILYELIEKPEAGVRFKLSFITNATVWDKKFWELASKVPNSISHVTISVDGGDRETYAELRGKDMFDRVLKNVDRYIAWGKEYSLTARLPVVINSMVQTKTYPQFRKIIDLWACRDVSLHFIPLIIRYKPDSDSQCFLIKEHQRPCMDALQEALSYAGTLELHPWQKISITKSLKRNIQYLEDIINNTEKISRYRG